MFFSFFMFPVFMFCSLVYRIENRFVFIKSLHTTNVFRTLPDETCRFHEESSEAVRESRQTESRVSLDPEDVDVICLPNIVFGREKLLLPLKKKNPYLISRAKKIETSRLGR